MKLRHAIGRSVAACAGRAAVAAWMPWAVATAAGFLLLVRGTTILSPLMAGDAYAYFAHARMAGHLGELYAADPMIQRVNNPLFFWIGSLACRMAGGDGTFIVRGLNVALFVAGCGLCASLARSISHPLDRSAALFVLLLMPLSSYCHCFMPEMTYFFLVVALSVVLTTGAAPLDGTSAFGVGGLLGALLCTKPHAVAVAAAVAAFAVAQHARASGGVRGLVAAARGLVTVAAGAVVVWVAIHLAFSGGLPSGAWDAIGAVYAPFVNRGLAGEFGVLHFVLVLVKHLMVIGAVFAVPVLVLARWVAGDAIARTEEATGDRAAACRLAAWALLLLGAAILLAVVFTTIVARNVPSEALRVHGRYYGFALPLVLAAWVAAFPAIRVEPWFSRWVVGAAAIGSICAGGCAAVGPGWFTIFPWDYPEALGLSHWPGLGSHAVVLPWIIAGMTMLSAIVIARRPQWALWAAGTMLTLVFIAGQYNVWCWQQENTGTGGCIAREARAVATLLPVESRDRGLVVGERRHGRMAYALYGLAANSRVLVRPALSVLGRKDIPGDVQWILTTDPIAIDVACQFVIVGQETNFYRLPPDSRGPNDGPLVVVPGSASEPTVFVGFNPREPMGRWSALPIARLLLPRHVAGPVTVRLQGWAARPEPQRLVVELGDGTAVVPVDGESRVHTFDIDTGAGGSVMTLRGVDPVRPHPWDRPLGVAVQRVEIQPPPAGADAAGRR